MIYIAHLHQARLITKKLDPNYEIPPFSFASYPALKDMFISIKIYLKKLSSGPKSEADSKRKVLSLVKDLQKTVMACKNSLHRITDQVVGIQEKLELVEKKVKVLEKEKSRKHVPSEKLSDKVDEQILKMLREKEKKKQKKKEPKKKTTEESEK